MRKTNLEKAMEWYDKHFVSNWIRYEYPFYYQIKGEPGERNKLYRDPLVAVFEKPVRWKFKTPLWFCVYLQTIPISLYREPKPVKEVVKTFKSRYMQYPYLLRYSSLEDGLCFDKALLYSINFEKGKIKIDYCDDYKKFIEYNDLNKTLKTIIKDTVGEFVRDAKVYKIIA